MILVLKLYFRLFFSNILWFWSFIGVEWFWYATIGWRK